MYKIRTNQLADRISTGQLKRFFNDFDGGFKIDFVKDTNDKELAYTINKTMMRIDLPKNLNNGESFTFKIKWWYNITRERISSIQKVQDEATPKNISSIRNEQIKETQDEKDRSLLDFYTDFDPYKPSILGKQKYEKYLTSLSEEER